MTPIDPKAGPTAPIYDHSNGSVHVPLTGRPGFAVLDIEDFDTLRKRHDLVLSPLRFARHYGSPAVRARLLVSSSDEFTPSLLVANLVYRPPAGHYIGYRDGDPLNLRRSNLVAVPVNQQEVA